LTLPTTTRRGPYFRVAKPDWSDPSDTSFSRAAGGRWNPPGEFGALYLNASVRVAAAQARQQHAGRAIKLFDLRPDRRPILVTFEVPRRHVVDAVDPKGRVALALPPAFPFGVTHAPCQEIARRAYRAELDGVASRSNAEATATETLGEELALFDRVPAPRELRRQAFAEWYPDPIPG
jgi:RES domain-containing protein